MAEGTIKNRIVIEGEAEYKKALADINRALRESKSELKAVSAEYAQSSGSAQALTAQIAALESTHAQQTQQLELMQKHLAKVTAAYGENSREAVELRTKINNARAEMAKTGNELTQLRTRLDAAGDAMDDMTGGTGGAAEGLRDVGEEARSAQEDVDELAGSIADMMGQKLISIGIGKEVVTKLGGQIATLLRGAIADAMQGQTEDAMTRALAGDSALSERRTGIKDAVDRTWAGYRDGSQTVTDVAAVDTVLGNKGITDPERVKAVTDMAITQSVVFGQDIQTTMDRATAMVNAFGVSYEYAIDLMTKGQRDMSDGGAMMLSAFETYPQLFKQIGYDADDMYSAIATASNDVNLGKDSAFVKGVETLMTTLTSGSKESKTTLKALGIEVKDLPKKFQAGGDAAAEATQLVLTKLLAIEDVSKRNDLGKALFGDKVWTDSAGGIVDVILSGYGQIIDASGATQDAMDSVLGTLDAQMSGLSERVSQGAGEVFSPLVDGATNAIKEINQGIDEGDILGGLWSGYLAWGDGLHAWIDPVLGSIAQAGEDAAKAFTDAMQPDDTGMDESAKAYAESQKSAVVDQLTTAYGQENDEDFAAWQAFQQRLIDSAYEDSIEQAGQLGTDESQALLDKITEAEPDAQSTGEAFGGTLVEGTETGAEGMYDAGADAAQGAINGALSAMGDMRSAGKALGESFRGGFRWVMQIKSPSRAAKEDMGYVTEGYIEQAEQDRARLWDAAHALAETIRDGFGTPELPQPRMEAGAYGAGTDTLTLTEAMREAMSGMAFVMDAETMSVRLEPFVSRATSARSMSTVRGQSSNARSW